MNVGQEINALLWQSFEIALLPSSTQYYFQEIEN